MSAYIPKVLERILENTDTTTNKGIIIASPSTIPPYKYHWIRDSALVMRVFIDMYSRTKESKYFEYIMNYIENENKVQELNTISGLGEPKINIDCKPYNGDWGRPQNDGPALRSIMMLKIIDLFNYKYNLIIERMILPVIMKDLEYIIENYDKVSFDIWEEYCGWHFYTRLVQLKFLKEVISNRKILKISDEKLSKVKDIYAKLLKNIEDHIDNDNNTIISSFDKDGKIIKYADSSILLAYCHIDYDVEILKKFPIYRTEKVIEELLLYFREKYDDCEINLIGRYMDDKYYDGQIWIICSLSLAQVYLEIYKERNKVINRSPMNRAISNPNNDYFIIANDILEKILTLDVDFILPEQFNPITSEYYSAKKLTWNYSELYVLIRNIHP
tara:strand:- start:5165 stop:6325 length:1161 start_codon:yes stop_codon:yes gene_type:complete